eukprot:6457821-Amphidinium_carterae.7
MVHHLRSRVEAILHVPLCLANITPVPMSTIVPLPFRSKTSGTSSQQPASRTKKLLITKGCAKWPIKGTRCCRCARLSASSVVYTSSWALLIRLKSRGSRSGVDQGRVVGGDVSGGRRGGMRDGSECGHEHGSGRGRMCGRWSVVRVQWRLDGMRQRLEPDCQKWRWTMEVVVDVNLEVGSFSLSLYVNAICSMVSMLSSWLFRYELHVDGAKILAVLNANQGCE